jgi:uncharacterized repeat protein (TIGR03803 family)
MPPVSATRRSLPSGVHVMVTFAAGSLIQGTDGSFYGTTSTGGIGGSGTVFRLQPPAIRAGPQAHRLDEFPAGYPLAGCSPAEPTSVSPTGVSMQHNRSVGDDSPANGNLSLSQLSQGRGSVHSSVPGFPKGGPFQFFDRLIHRFRARD